MQKSVPSRVDPFMIAPWHGNDFCTPWWRHQMETFPALLALCVRNSPVTGEFPTQRPVTRGFDVFFDLRLNRRLSKQTLGWRFETSSRSLWRQCNDTHTVINVYLWRFLVIIWTTCSTHNRCVYWVGRRTWSLIAKSKWLNCHDINKCLCQTCMWSLHSFILMGFSCGVTRSMRPGTSWWDVMTLKQFLHYRYLWGKSTGHRWNSNMKGQ